MEAKKILQKLLELQNAYANTYRAMVTGERLKHTLLADKEVDVIAEKNREPLIEHVGHLPIIASYLYQHLERKNEVNLGRVLVMLSIHDIGETVTGDIMTYKKSSQDSKGEYEIAKTLLPEELVGFYDEFELGESLDAKFAKSVDAAAPFLHELVTPNLTRKRFAAHGFNADKIEAKKKQIFDWDSTLASIFNEVMIAYRKIELGESTGYSIYCDIKK